jgi:hypothetical protein
MTEFTMRPGAVRDAMANVQIFADNGIYANIIMKTDDKDNLVFLGSNGFVAICDGGVPVGVEIPEIVFPLKTFVEISTFIKKIKDLKTKPGTVKISIIETHQDGVVDVIFKNQENSEELETVGFTFESSSSIPVIGKQIIALFEEEYDKRHSVSKPFAIHPMNFQRLGHLKPENKIFVVDFILVPNPLKPDAQTLCVIKYGKTCRVIIAGIDRKRSAETLEQIEPGLSNECLW